MNKNEINSLKTRISDYIDHRRLRDAICEIKQLARKHMAWEVEDKVKLTEQNYELMLRYLTQGVTDPDRADVYSSIVADIYGLLDRLVSYIEAIDNPSLYYSTIRYNKMAIRRPSIAELAARYLSLSESLSAFALAADDKLDNTTADDHRKLESVQAEIFRQIWATPLLSGDDSGAIDEIMRSELYPSTLKQHIVSALTLALLQQYDSRKLELLMLAYMQQADIKVTSAALVGMLLGLWRYANRPLPRRLHDKLKLIKDMPAWHSDLSTAFIELIRARDTERINRKMRDEVLPSMTKLRPGMMDKINDGTINPEDIASLQENPEWQDMLDKSGLTDKLKELTEIQMEGGDVMMSTFAHLKQFAFFNEIANWFLPFDASHSSVAHVTRSIDVIGDFLENAPIFCDSDKYSLMLAIDSVPAKERSLMISQMQAQRDNLYEAMGQSIDADTQPEARRRSVNLYIQNIYRFFKLYSRKAEFVDPFDTGVNLIAVPALAEDFDDAEMLRMVAEFYFKLRYMQDALDVFTRLEQIRPGDASRYQKMGYCYERLGDPAKAVEYYQYSELLDTHSAWTTRRIAHCYRLLGDNASALEYYRRLSEMQPDDLKSTMLYGQALTENGKYAEAIKQFYKVEFLDEKSSAVWRPLAWTLFLTSDYDASQRYYQKIILDKPTATDYLNMGHVALAMGNMREAVNNYVLSIQTSHGDKATFLKALDDDMPALEQAGVDLGVVPLIVDAALYNLDSN